MVAVVRRCGSSSRPSAVIDAFVAGLFVGLFVAVFVGAAAMVVVETAIQQGLSVALAGGGGIATGDALWAALAAGAGAAPPHAARTRAKTITNAVINQRDVRIFAAITFSFGLIDVVWEQKTHGGTVEL